MEVHNKRRKEDGEGGERQMMEWGARRKEERRKGVEKGRDGRRGRRTEKYGMVPDRLVLGFDGVSFSAGRFSPADSSRPPSRVV